MVPEQEFAGFSSPQDFWGVGGDLCRWLDGRGAVCRGGVDGWQGGVDRVKVRDKTKRKKTIVIEVRE
jgi:hypothetical protein